MRCASCEHLILRVLRELPGVEEAEVSLRKRRAGIRISDEAPPPSVDALNRRLEAHGYRLGPETPAMAGGGNACSRNPQNDRAPFGRRIFRAIFLVAVFGLAASLLWGPVQRVIPNASPAVSATALIGLGLVASLSSCLASTGGFLLAYAAKKKNASIFAIHAGRFAAFVLGGGILGGLGGMLPVITTRATGILSLMFGGVLLWAGLRLLDLAPSLAVLGIRPPKRLAGLADQSAASLSHGRIADFAAGAATFVLPCGFTQTAQMLALSSGSAIAGAGLLAAFALGTLPALAGLSAFGRSTSGTTAHNLKFAAGAMLVVFSVIHIDGGLTLVGSRVTLIGAIESITKTSTASGVSASAQAASEQVVRMSVTGSGYAPNRITVRVGVPVKWIIEGSGAGGCTRDIVVPSYGIERTLARGENVIAFTPKERGAIPFSCGMGMVRGAFNVI
jgi:uncharacterized protein